MEKKNSEHATAEKILQAAEEVFISRGFAGSSINEIAGKAKVHKSLIYHHFGSKEALWKAVKTSLLEAHSGKDITQLDFPLGISFKDFLTSAVTLRFNFYDKNPAIARLVSWQRLEKADNIKGITDERLNTVIPQIEEFQRQGEVRSNLDPEMVSYMIMNTTSLPFMETPEFFKGENSKQNKQKFLEMMIEGLYLAFSTQKDSGNRSYPRIYSV